MITRIVKMTFQENKVDDFLKLFESHKNLIRAREGCVGLKLLQDLHATHIFFTYSHWQAEEYLNAYRKSELFGKVWPATKTLFAEAPQAWTVVEKVKVDL